MWAVLGKIALSVGAVWVIAALSAKLARKSAALEQAEREGIEREKVDKIINATAGLGRDELLNRLRGNADKK